MDLVLLFFRLK